MKQKLKAAYILDRENMSETEKVLFVRDLMKVAEDYFEPQGQARLDVVRTENGYSVCVVFDAARIKKLWKPQ